MPPLAHNGMTFSRQAQLVIVLALLPCWFAAPDNNAQSSPSPIHFDLRKIPFRLENDETPAKNAPEAMAGGVAVFDYNGDGRPDIFFTNGANIATLKKDSPKYRNRLFRNDGNGVFTDVTDAAGLAGTGYRHGCCRRRLRQRRPSRPVCGRLLQEHAVPQQRRRNLHRRDCEGGPRQIERSSVWALVGHCRRLGRREQRWPARSLRRQLHAMEVFRPATLRLSRHCRLLPSTVLQAYTRPALPQQWRRHVSRRFGGSGACAIIRAKAWASGMADYDLDGRQDLFVTNDAGLCSSSFTISETSSKRWLSMPVWRCPKTGTSSPVWDSIFATSTTMAIPTSPMSP